MAPLLSPALQSLLFQTQHLSRFLVPPRFILCLCKHKLYPVFFCISFKQSNVLVSSTSFSQSKQKKKVFHFLLRYLSNTARIPFSTAVHNTSYFLLRIFFLDSIFVGYCIVFPFRPYSLSMRYCDALLYPLTIPLFPLRYCTASSPLLYYAVTPLATTEKGFPLFSTQHSVSHIHYIK